MAMGHGDLLGAPIHGADVAQVHHHGLVAQMLERHIAEVEMNAFHQHIGADKRAHIAFAQNSCIITYAFDGGSIAQFHALGNAVYETELAQFLQFGASVVLKHVRCLAD
jgi:hypothetical protein